MEAPALGPVFSPVAHILNSPELGPRDSTGATLLISCPIFTKASICVWCRGAPPSPLPGVTHMLLLVDLPETGHWLGSMT